MLKKSQHVYNQEYNLFLLYKQQKVALTETLIFQQYKDNKKSFV